MAELIGTVTSIRVAVSRKMGDGDYGSYGVDAAVEVALPVGASVADAFDAWDAWLTASIGQSMKEKADLIAKGKPTKPEPPAGVDPNSGEVVYAKPASEAIQLAPAPAHAPEPARVPVDDGGNEGLTMTISGIAHSMTMNGDHICKVFGNAGPQHNFEVFGVTAWPEVMKTAEVHGWEDWPICKASDKGFSKENRFQMPLGYTKAVVQMGPNKNGKIVPQRVWRFEK